MSQPLKTVLFVCTGNTCRSPMAEGLFRKAAGSDYVVSSAGVAAHPGSAASRETLDILAQQDAPLGQFRSRMVDEAMLVEADAIFCMTESHLAQLERLYPEHEEKYHLACDFLEIDGVVGADVPDPIGMGKLAYEQVSRILEEANKGILGFLAAQHDSQD